MADHIQIPQTWMRNFMNKNNPLPNSVYCLSLPRFIVGCVKIKELGAVDNYYIKDFEHYLDIEWETKIGLIFKNIRLGAKHGEVSLSSEEIIFIKRFLAVSVARSKSYKQFCRENDKSGLPFIGENEINPLSVIESGGMLFKDCGYQFIINSTAIGFVLPSYSYYYVVSENEHIAVMVISSKIAIFFVERNSKRLNSGNLIRISDAIFIKKLNYWALVCERKTNNDFLIAEKPSDFTFETNEGV